MTTTYLTYTKASCLKQCRLAVLLTAAFITSGTHAQEQQLPDTTRTDAREHVQFNALDHVLQKGYGNERFPSKKFGDRLFLSVEGGLTSLHTPGYLARLTRPGVQGGVTVGDWITPVHGLRLGANAGQYKSAAGNLTHLGLSADYLMNLSALVRKDNPERKVEVIGIAGAELQMVKDKYNGKWTINPGFRIGLQTRFNVSRSTFLYIEPRIGLYSDNIDGIKQYLKYDYAASLMVGLGYRLNGGRGHRQWEGLTPFSNESFADNMFFGLSGGAGTFICRSAKHMWSSAGPIASAHIGKWFSSISALRLSASGGYMNNFADTRSKITALDLDYLFNFTSALSGYNPYGLFHTNFGIGGVIAYAHGGNGTPKKLYPGLSVSMQGVFRLSDQFSLYIEPKARVFARSFSENVTHRRSRGDILASLMVGLQYQIDGGYKSSQDSYESDYQDFLKANNWFLSLGGGSTANGKRFNNSYSVSGSLGQWFTPVSAWRAGFDFNHFIDEPRRIALSAAVDYMLSLSTLSAGYNPDRVFDLTAVVGISGGASHLSQNYDFIVGGKAGLQGRFILSPSFELFIEPQFILERVPKAHVNYSYGRVLAGITYRIGSGRKDGESSILQPFDGEQRNFVSIAGGMGLFSETLLRERLRNVGGSVDLSVGRWLTRVSGISAGISYDFVPIKGYKQLKIGTAHINYMANLTSLFNYDPDNKFHVIAEVGGGIGWNNYKGSGIAGSVQAGLQFRYNLPSNIDVFIQPDIILWEPRMCSILENTHKFVGNGRLMGGIAYRF